LHRQQSYAKLAERDLPVTDAVSARVVSLPIYEALSDADIDRVSATIVQLHHDAGDVRAAIVA
jgi:dTDP-4-amino-4,6-dideoxygalactose transaminase